MRNSLKHILFILSLLNVTFAFAQTYQAESATFQGEVSNGAVWLKQETDYVKFYVSASSSGTATVSIGVQSPYGDKVFNWQVNSKSGSVHTGEGTHEISLGTVALNAGTNTILITPNWTWFGVDYLRISGMNTSGDSGSGEDIKPTGTFQVSDTQLLDGNGKPFRIMGANLAYAWFKGYGFERQMEAMKRAGANAVRIALSDGDKYGKDSYQTLQSMIAKAEQLKMVLIVEIHDATGSDDPQALQHATQWFVEMKNALIGHESTVIINVANEWMGTWKQYSAYASGYQSAIQSIRNAGLKHCLMIDAAGWGQEVNSITSQGQNILNSDPLKNILFSIHMYGTAGAPGRVASNINNVLNHDLALCIGEFAWYHTDGDVDEDAIISTCRERNIGWLAWSWWGNGGGLNYIDLVKDQYNENSYYTQSEKGMSCDWGKKVMDAWRSEAHICTVYEKQTEIETITQPDAEIVAIYDLSGRKVGNSLSQISNRGIYIIVEQNNNIFSTRKIIIQ